MVNINIKCDRCGNLIMGHRNKYYMDNDCYKMSSNEKYMFERIKDGSNYNVFIRFNSSRWEPNTYSKNSDYGILDTNGFILCEDCIEKLEKFLMNEVE